MSAPTERPDNPNTNARAIRLGLGQSVAARAHAAAEVADQLRDSTSPSKVSVGSTITVTPARARFLDPDVPFAVVGGLVGVMLGVAVIALERFPLADIWRQPTIDRTIELASSSARPAPATLAIQAEPAIPRLIVQSSRGMSGKPAPLGLTLQGRAEGAVVIITGLMPGMELSMGGAVGADAWKMLATDLDDAWISPLESFVGSVDLVAELRLPDDKISDRQAIHFEWAPPISPAPAQQQLDREEITAVPPISAAPAQRQLDREEITAVPPISPTPAQRQRDREEITAVSISPTPAQRQFDREEITAVPPISPTAAQTKLDQEEIAAVPPSSRMLAQNKLDREEITAVPPISPTPEQRQLDRDEITTVPPISPTPAQRQLDREEITAVPPISPMPARRQLDREEITVLLKRGKDLIANGDLAAARIVLQRAAEANDAEAALALGATYDPFVLRELKVYGFTADAAAARAWYEKARVFGSAAASRRLEMLTIGAR